MEAEDGRNSGEESMSNLTEAHLSMLGRIAAKEPILELLLVSSGGRSSKLLNDLLAWGLADMTAHPTVKDRKGNAPAAAVILTEKGRNTIGGGA